MQESVDDAIIAQDGGNDVQLTLEAWKPEGEAFSDSAMSRSRNAWFYFSHGFWRYDGRSIFDFPRRAVLLDMVVEEETWLRPMDQMHEYAGAEDSEKKKSGWHWSMFSNLGWKMRWAEELSESGKRAHLDHGRVCHEHAQYIQVEKFWAK